MTNSNRFYVYAYLRADGTPYYIGKGTGNRINQRAYHYVNLPPVARRIKLIWDETSDFCYRYEEMLISYYGKKCDGTGILRNIADGGKGSKGSRHTDSHKAYMSEIMTGRPKPEQMKVRMREVAAARPSDYYDSWNKSNAVDRQWAHPEHGVRSCTQAELIQEFPSLSQGNLSKVVRGIIKRHKGWECLTPSASFVAKSPNNAASVEARLLNNAELVGLSLDEYKNLSPWQRRKRLAAARAA